MYLEEDDKKFRIIKNVIFTILIIMASIVLNINHGMDIKNNKQPSTEIIKTDTIIQVVQPSKVNITNNQKAALFLLIPIGAMIFIFIGVLFDFFKKVREYQKMSKIKFK